MKRISLVFLLMIVAVTLVAQVGKTNHPLLSAIFLINDEGDTLKFETFKYDELDRCVQIVTQTSDYNLLQSIIYPDKRTVVVTSATDYSKSVAIYELNEAGQALTCSVISQTDEGTDTLVGRIKHFSNGFSINLSDYDLGTMGDDDLKDLGINLDDFIVVSNGNIIENVSGTTYEYFRDHQNTTGMLNQGIYFLGTDNKNPVKSLTVKEEDEYGESYDNTYSFEYVFDDQGRIIKQMSTWDDSLYNSFIYVEK